MRRANCWDHPQTAESGACAGPARAQVVARTSCAVIYEIDGDVIRIPRDFHNTQRWLLVH